MICVFALAYWNNFLWAGYAYYDVLRLDKESNDHKKQTWIAKIDPAYGTFLFESTYWDRGNYLRNEGRWLYCDPDGLYTRWNVTVSNCNIFCIWNSNSTKTQRIAVFWKCLIMEINVLFDTIVENILINSLQNNISIQNIKNGKNRENI